MNRIRRKGKKIVINDTTISYRLIYIVNLHFECLGF